MGHNTSNVPEMKHKVNKWNSRCPLQIQPAFFWTSGECMCNVPIPTLIAVKVLELWPRSLPPSQWLPRLMLGKSHNYVRLIALKLFEFSFANQFLLSTIGNFESEGHSSISTCTLCHVSYWHLIEVLEISKCLQMFGATDRCPNGWPEP